MTLYVSEKEMLERFLDSLNKAASRAQDITTSEQSERPRLFVQFIEAVKVAAGSAHQMAHTQMNPKWLDIRDFLEKVIEAGQALPMVGPSENILWINIRMSLLTLMDNGEKLALAKSMPRNQVLTHLLTREKANRPETRDEKPKLIL